MATTKYTVQILLNEEPEVIRLLEEQAEREGTDRTKLIRRAIRRELGLFLPPVSTHGNLRDEEAPQAA
jgi:flagellar biosynthesis component FlhA